VSHKEVTFAAMGLENPVHKALVELGYENPTPIQAAAIPPLLSGDDVVGQAKTGTGKTAAFALPLLGKIDISKKVPQLLVMAPTRELALQVCEAVKGYGQFMKGLRVLPVYGGQGMDKQLRELKRGVHVVVGTPGRLRDHLERKTMKLDQLKALVIDEADELLRMGFLEEVEVILKATPDERQTALFSATMPKQIRNIASRFLNDPTEIKLKTKVTTVESVSQQYMFVSGLAKLKALDRYLEVEPYDGMIIFVRTRVNTVELAENLKGLGHTAVSLNGDMSQPVRERTVDRFKRGAFNILVCTDVAARGLDVPRISHVINFDIPQDTESYVHRIGRTGRAGREGKALLFAGRREQRMLRNIERATRQTIERVSVPTDRHLGEHRVTRFQEKLLSTITDVNLGYFKRLVDTLCDKEGCDAETVAAALMYQAQKDRPFMVHGGAMEDSESGRKNKVTGQDSKGRSRTGVQLYRVEIGRSHGLQPKHLAGAIVNEGNLSNRAIGAIRIRDVYATVELPVDLPGDLVNHLKKVRLFGKKLQLKAITDRPRKSSDSSKRHDDKPREKFDHRGSKNKRGGAKWGRGAKDSDGDSGSRRSRPKNKLKSRGKKKHSGGWGKKSPKK